MTDLYVHIADGAVDYGPAALPRNWRHVSSLDGLSDEELAPLGWHRCGSTDDGPAYDPRWQTRAGPVAVADGAGWVAQWAVADRPLADVRAECLAAVRAEAGARILAIAPAYRQANLTARAAEIALFESLPWSPAIQAELANGAAVWTAIKQIRAASDVAEIAISAAETAEAAAAVVAVWP